ncbi:MAG: NAD(P)H-binding protein [Ferruginibacter sp.]
MNITIIGAGAGVGKEAVIQALEKGHYVTALSTNLAMLPDAANLKKIEGSATSKEDVNAAIWNADAILITVGTKKKKGTTLFSDIAKTIIQLHEEIKFKAPVIAISGFGVGYSSKYLGLFMKLVISLFLKDQYKDKALMEKLFEESSVNWEMVQPGMLTNGALTQSYKTFPGLFKGIKIGKISRADVAHFMVMEAERQSMLYKKVAITGSPKIN